MVQLLRLHTSTANGTGLIPDWGSKFPHVSRCSPKLINMIVQKWLCTKTYRVVLLWAIFFCLWLFLVWKQTASSEKLSYFFLTITKSSANFFLTITKPSAKIEFYTFMKETLIYKMIWMDPHEFFNCMKFIEKWERNYRVGLTVFTSYPISYTVTLRNKAS